MLRPSYYTLRTVTMTMDCEIVGTRAVESKRFVIPFDPIREEYRESSATRLEEGTILAFEKHEKLDKATIVFQTARGPRTLRIANFSTSLRLGDAKTRRLFPQDLVWPGLSGQTVRIERGGEIGREILWVVR